MKKIYVWMSFFLIAYLMGSIGLQFFNLNETVDYSLDPFEEGNPESDSDLISLTGMSLITSTLLGFGVVLGAFVLSAGTIPLDKAIAYGFFTGVFAAIWTLGTGMINDVTTQVNSVFHTSLPMALILTIIGVFVWGVGMTAVMGTDIEGY